MSQSFAVIEDDRDQRQQLAAILETGGARCTAFADAASFLKGVHRDTFDLVCIDWNMPGISGLELVRRIRTGAQAPKLPIIIVTSRDSAEDIVAGLEAGADDYIVKPVDQTVLRARAAAVLRRASPPATEAIETFGDYSFDSTQSKVTTSAGDAGLTTKEFVLALLLFRNLHRPLARAYLLEEVWGLGANVGSRTLDTHIYRLKSKLHLSPERGFHLGPVYGYGYRLERLNGDGG